MKIKIAVAVNKVGGWAALGAFGEKDDAVQSAVNKVSSDDGAIPTTLYWVEVELPDAQPIPTVKAEAQPNQVTAPEEI